MITCTFAGHHDIYETAAMDKVLALLHYLMGLDDEFCFFSGGMGRFDLMCEGKVNQIKKLYPEKKIQLLLILPYMKQSINTHGEYYYDRYDEIVLPGELDGCHYKAAITRRNRWMVDRSDYMIAYIKETYGNSFTTFKYARRRKITIWNVAEKPVNYYDVYPEIWGAEK